MPKLSDRAFTDTLLRKMKAPSTRTDMYDAVQRGLGLRLAPSGTKTWFAMRRVGGRMTRVTIGRYPEVGLAEARRQASDLFEQMSAGTISKPKAPPKLSEVVEDWLMRDQEGKQRKSAAEKRRALTRDVLPVLGDMSVDSITKQDIQKLLSRVVDSGSPIHANRLLAYLRRMFNWAIEQDILTLSPIVGIRQPSDERSRDRTLSATELRAIWRAANQLGQPFGPCLKMLVLTGQRRSEVVGARWDEFDLVKGEWAIPGSRAKNGMSHLVHLPEQTLEILNSVKQVDNSDLVFTTTGITPVSGFSRIKLRVDELSGVTAWRIHDLRRTFATIATGDLGIEPAVVDKILNHSSGAVTGIAAVYQRHAYLDQRKQAMDRWGQFVANLVS